MDDIRRHGAANTQDHSGQPAGATPETDAILPKGSAANPEVQHVALQLAGLARSLETRLAAAQAEVERIKQVADELSEKVMSLAIDKDTLTAELAEERNPNVDGSLAFHLAESNQRENDLRALFEKAKQWNALTELEMKNLRSLNQGLEEDLKKERKVEKWTASANAKYPPTQPTHERH